MDIVANIITYLKTVPTITAVVGNRIYPYWYPENKTYPFIVIGATQQGFDDDGENLRNITVETRCYTLNDISGAKSLDNNLKNAFGVSTLNDLVYISGAMLSDPDNPSSIYYLSELETQFSV